MIGLSDDDLAKAAEELAEEASTRSYGIELLREQVLSTHGLFCPVDDSFLLRFMRARKFDSDKALVLLKTYYEVRREYPSIFSNLKPSQVRQVYEDQVITRLPGRGPQGTAVIYMRPGLWNPDKYTFLDVIRAHVIQFEKIIQEESTQINGIIAIVNVKDAGWLQLKRIPIFLARRLATIIQSAFPCRMKGIHYVNVPRVFETLYSFIKPLLTKKLQSRVTISATTGYLKDVLDEDFLPDDMGGELDVNGSSKDWSDYLLSCEDEYETMAKYMLLSTSEGSCLQDDSVQAMDMATAGLYGSFRKLNVD